MRSSRVPARFPAMQRRLVIALPLVLLVLIGMVWRVASARPVPGAQLAAASNKKSVLPSTATANPSAGAPFLYTANDAQPLATIVRRLWPSTSYMTRAEFEAALREANHLRPN